MPASKQRRKRIALALLPFVLALHVYLIVLGGWWRLFALAEAGVGVFVALAVREFKKLDAVPTEKPKSPR